MTSKRIGSKQLELKRTRGWGGRRNGAGRPNRSNTVNHMARAKVTSRYPLHVTMRLKKNLPTLRRQEFLREFEVGIQMAGRLGFRVIHFSLQSHHIHMLVEAKNNDSMARGMQSVAARFAKIIRRRNGGQGSVFAGRYHLHVLKTPIEAKRALEYVLFNSAKHRDLIVHVDPYSSAHKFQHFRQLLGDKYDGLNCEQVKEMRPSDYSVFKPRSWLATVGWMRAP